MANKIKKRPFKVRRQPTELGNALKLARIMNYIESKLKLWQGTRKEPAQTFKQERNEIEKTIRTILQN